MRIVGRLLIEAFYEQHAGARSQLDSWLNEAEEAQWQTPKDLKIRYPSASLLGAGRVVFNIRGNKYRLLVRVNYKNQVVRIEKIGTHAEYSEWRL